MAAKETPRYAGRIVGAAFFPRAMEPADALALAESLAEPIRRNGQPVTACDFCGAETNGRFCDPAGLYLEEGDLYACGTCWERWMAEDARDWKALALGEEPG